MHNLNNCLNKSGRKIKILILRPEGSLGDAVLSSGYYNSLKQFNKNIEIHVFCFHSAYEYCKNLKDIDHIYRVRMSKLRKHRGFIIFTLLGLYLRCKCFDLVIDDNPFKGKNWYWFTSVIGKKKLFRSKKLYSTVYARVEAVLAELGVPYIRPKIEVSPEAKSTVVKFLKSNKIDKFIVFNCFGSVANKTFTPDTFKKMFKEIRMKNKDIPVIFPFQPFLKNRISEFKLEDKNLFFFSTPTPQEVCALISEQGNILLVSPDTSFVHIAALLNKNTIAVLKDIDRYPTCNESAVEITADIKNVNDFDIKFFTQALQRYFI